MTALLRALTRKQRQYVELLAKVERTVARLHRRRRRLSELESTIADFEDRIAGAHDRHSTRNEAVPGLRRARLIFHPAPGHDEADNALRLSRIMSSLRGHGIEPALWRKTSGKAARALARDAVRDGLPLVVVAAGDGTVVDVASQLIGTSTALGIVPIGTVNNVARSLGVPLEIDDACALIGTGTTRHIDAGCVYSNRDSRDQYFLECAGVVLSATRTPAGRTLGKGRPRSLPKAVRRLFEAGGGTLRVELDGTAIEGPVRIVTVSNAPLIGDNVLAAPRAKMDDGYLDVSVYDGRGDGDLFRHFLATSSHRPDASRIYRARRVSITAEGAVPANTDTRIPPGRSVVEVEVVPAALTMIVGNGIGLTTTAESAPSASAFGAAPPSPNGPSADGAVRPAPAHA